MCLFVESEAFRSQRRFKALIREEGVPYLSGGHRCGPFNFALLRADYCWRASLYSNLI